MKSLSLIFISTIIILAAILILIYMNRGSQNIYGLTIKVLSPLLVSLSLILWELTSKDKKHDESFYTIGLYHKDDGFPINLGSVYYTTFNKGVCYSAFTSAFKNTDYKTKVNEFVESKHPHVKIEENGKEIYRKIDNYNSTNNIGEFSINLVAIAYLQGFLAREYKLEWDKNETEVKWLGAGMGITPVLQNDVNTNSEQIIVENLVSDLNIELKESAKGYQFVVPKDGKLNVELDDKAQFKSVKVKYTSPRIKNYEVKVTVERYGHVYQGKVADALEKEIDISKIFATYYRFDINYSTFWYNRFSPETNREITWINNQIRQMKDYFSWDEIESDLVYAINNYNKEKNRFDLKAKDEKKPPTFTSVEISNLNLQEGQTITIEPITEEKKE